jgi:ribosomal protein S18 acetylase RimI-like enzyme
MSVSITLAGPENLASLCVLCKAFHAEMGIELSDEERRTALTPLLEGTPYGAAYLMGPPRAPIGYIVVTFGWSVEFGGLDAIIDELYVRPGVRGKGIAKETLIALPRALTQGGLRAVHLEVDREDTRAITLYRRAGFAPRETYMFMSKRL